MDADSIALKLSRGLTAGQTYYTRNPDTNRLNGVIFISQPDTVNRTLHIEHILCTERDALRNFIERFHILFPGYTLKANRRDKPVTYVNTPRLCKLLNLVK